MLTYETAKFPQSTFSLTAYTLFAADLVLHDPSPVASTIAAVLSHFNSMTGVGKHRDSLNVLIYFANTSVPANA